MNKFFTVKEIDGVWWFVEPNGNKMLSKGICTINYEQDISLKLGYSPYRKTVDKKYTSYDHWGKAVTDRLKNIGINTAGAWSSYEAEKNIYYTHILEFLPEAKQEYRMQLVDIFNARFEESCDKTAKNKTCKYIDDANLIGYFVDNEISFGNNWLSDDSLFDQFFTLSNKADGKKTAMQVIKNQLGSITKFNQVFKSEYESFEELSNQDNFYNVCKNVKQDYLFAKLKTLRECLTVFDEYCFCTRHKTVDEINLKYGVLYDSLKSVVRDETQTDVSKIIAKIESEFLRSYANRYYLVTSQAVKKYDKNHLLLGTRFGGLCAVETVEECGKYNDVVSINRYDDEPPLEYFTNMYKLCKKPIMVGEFSTRGADTKHGNNVGAGGVVPTQKERAFRYSRYVENAVKLPFFIGYHWFEHCDEPYEGRFDGENSNYGIVNLDDELYEELAQQMKKTNELADKLHQTGK